MDPSGCLSHLQPLCAARTARTARTADNLKYKFMVAYDRAIMHLDKAFGFVAAPHSWVSRKDEGDQIIVLERGG